MKEFGFCMKLVLRIVRNPFWKRVYWQTEKRELIIKEVTAYHEHYPVEK